MNNLTNEQIARVLNLHSGCEIALYYEDDRTTPYERFILKAAYEECDCLFIIEDGAHSYQPNLFNLFLTPLSAISDEDFTICAKMQFPLKKKVDAEEMFNQEHEMNFRPLVFQYLIQRGYAVPLFIVPNHPDNGKTAIELGLAIDKTKQIAEVQ